jgi:hypothetical protein
MAIRTVEGQKSNIARRQETARGWQPICPGTKRRIFNILVMYQHSASRGLPDSTERIRPGEPLAPLSRRMPSGVLAL